MSELNQLLLDFDYKTNFNEHDFYLSKSNSNAFNLINRWPDWDKKILNISGEKFSGKSHLANIFKLKSKASGEVVKKLQSINFDLSVSLNLFFI